MAEFLNLASLLGGRRDRIVSRFVAETQRQGLPPKEVPRPLLTDHIPRFLDEITAAISPSDSARSYDAQAAARTTARDHGEQRWNLGYDVAALTREYGILHQCILYEAKEADTPLTPDEAVSLVRFMSVGVEQATVEYVRHRDEELNAQKSHLEFLAGAGQLLSSSLDYHSTLHRLAGLLIPRMADWCAVHLEGVSAEDMPIAHIDPSKVETLRGLYRNYPLVRSPSGYGRVVQTGEPLLVCEIEPDYVERVAGNPEQLALLKSIDTKSWIVVPLSVQSKIIGALTVAFSTSGRRYGERDLIVMTDLAHRAAVAIDNARLYQLSQSERSRVEAGNRAKDEFVQMISHELRTPLNAINGWTRLLQAGALSEAKREHALHVIERNAKAQTRLVDDLLDISRTLTGTIRIQPSQVDLSNIVDIAIEGVRPAAEAKRIQIEVDVDRERSVMRGDGDRLHQVVWNLLVNAVKFTPKGGRIHVTLRRVESDLELKMEDTGIGIAANFLPHLFDSFRQFDGSTTRTQGGLGLGLSIAKHLIDLHGGTIVAQSEGEGRGSRFIVRLPISPLVSTTVGIARVPATKQASGEFQLPVADTSIRVLAVDDDEDARELLEVLFSASHIEIRMASSAAEALRILETYVPDVIVSDIGMPDEDGYAFIRHVRTLPNDRKNIPAIALTAFSGSENRNRARVDGFNVHMEKPVEPAKLVNAVLELAGAYPRPRDPSHESK